VSSPLGKVLPQCLVYPPSSPVPETCIDTEGLSTSLFVRDATYIAGILRNAQFSNAAASRLLTNLESTVTDKVFHILFTEEYSDSDEVIQDENTSSDKEMSSHEEEESGDSDMD